MFATLYSVAMSWHFGAETIMYNLVTSVARKMVIIQWGGGGGGFLVLNDAAEIQACQSFNLRRRITSEGPNSSHCVCGKGWASNSHCSSCDSPHSTLKVILQRTGDSESLCTLIPSPVTTRNVYRSKHRLWITSKVVFQKETTVENMT